MQSTITHDGLAYVTYGPCPACKGVCMELRWVPEHGRRCAGCAYDLLVAFMRTLASAEYTDAHGDVWLIWRDRSVRLEAYQARRPAA